MTAFEQALKNYWDNADAHRRGKTDMQWVNEQRQGPPRFMMGDIVEFKVGGFGMIKDVSKAHDGWPVSYSADEVPGMPYHSGNKHAWHYEGDIKKLVAKSAIRSVKPKLP